MNSDSTLNVAVTAMNILDGLETHAHWDQLQPAWEHQGYGFCEFCRWLAEVALLSEQMLNNNQPDQEFPGVYDYEVSYPLGKLIRQHMVSTGSVPEDADVKHWLQVLFDGFFKQGKAK